MSEFRTWEQMTELEQLGCTFWDMYKDAMGFRPRNIDTSNWTKEMFLAEFDRLGEIIEREETERVISEQKAIIRFETQVLSFIEDGKVSSRNQAIALFHTLEDTDGDVGDLCYKLGLPYGYLKKKDY